MATDLRTCSQSSAVAGEAVGVDGFGEWSIAATLANVCSQRAR